MSALDARGALSRDKIKSTTMSPELCLRCAVHTGHALRLSFYRFFKRWLFMGEILSFCERSTYLL